jgi:nitrite reductase/ring-hydroxylating ferredoxin subunit/DMSO/TMAO reductase YedYZ heme-binding membrane subunit
MSVGYKPVGWTRFKLLYDGVLVAGVLLYLLVYLRIGPHVAVGPLGRDGPTTVMDAFGTCAFIMLSVALCIGPLARIDPRFLPLLYNRRHLGVLTAIVATGHARAVLGWYFAYSRIPPLRGLFTADTGSGWLHGLPFIPFGMVALLILWLLAATSHDFWLAFLTPPVWKALHLTVYAAYALLVLHLGLGALQDAGSPALAALAMLSLASVCALHLAAGLLERGDPPDPAVNGWIVAAQLVDLADGQAVIVPVAPGRSAAVFRHDGRLAAIANQCAHQNGPLGEGRIIDGCVVCPWHGYQYRLEDGCSPPPFTEKVATYRLALDRGVVMLDPEPLPPGTHAEPITL